MEDMRLNRFVQRCESAAAWRTAVDQRHGDSRSAHAATALLEAAMWARTSDEAAQLLDQELGSLFDDPQREWTESQEYAFTTYCLHGDESREAWLQRVRTQPF